MSGQNFIPNKALISMRNQFLECKQQLKHMKYLYKNECVNNSKFRQVFRSVTDENIQLKKKITELETSNKTHISPTSKPLKRKRKKWHEITSEQTK